jgi:hypothetical protein
MKDFRPVTHLSFTLNRKPPDLEVGSCRPGAARRRLRPILSLGLVLALAACARPAPVTSTPAVVTPADPVLAFVGTAQLGLPAEVAAPADGGTVTVEVQSQYFAASGYICRTYQVTAPGGGSHAGLACREGSTWQNIPPLTSGDTVGAPS